MKRLLLALSVALMATPAMADIQDPPMHDHGPARKLGRGWANFLYGSAEVWTTVQRTNELEGNTAAATYGIVKGFGRMFARMGTGVYEIFTYPFPTYKRSYRPSLRPSVPWVNGGYDEFPPEFGFQSKRRYNTTSDRY